MAKAAGKKRHILRNILIGLLIVVILLGIGIKVVLNKLNVDYPELSSDYEIGQWYKVSPEGARSSDGSEWHGIFRKGTENKVVVYFFGGGVSITPETSEGGKKFYATNMMAQNFVIQGGISSNAEDNPFKDWSFIVIPYATGDFHAGTGTYEGKKTVYHTGYNNYSACVEQVKQYLGEPDTLLVTGFSAGGFATSLLSDDVIDRFPSAENVTVCVDSSLLLYDGWHETAVDLWKSPIQISDRLTTNNIVLDSLTALHEKRGDSVKILFDCSYRDDTLMQYQSYIDSGKMEKTKELGDKFQCDLKEMVNGLQTNIPNVGIYIWRCGEDSSTHNTQHTIISSNLFDKLGNDRSVGEWIYDAVNGDVETYGLELLDKTF